MEVLSSRMLLRPTDLDRSIVFYRQSLGLAVYREFGEGENRGVVFFTGSGFLEVSGTSGHEARLASAAFEVALWFQVRSADEAHVELAAKGVMIRRPPTDMPWGLREFWIADPDGLGIAVVEVPEDHPLRRR